jgi:hypothetical protein
MSLWLFSLPAEVVDLSARRASSAGVFWKTNDGGLTWSIFDGAVAPVSQGLIESKTGHVV